MRVWFSPHFPQHIPTAVTEPPRRPPNRSLSTGLPAHEERACGRDRTVETSVPMPVSPALFRARGGGSARMARKHRRSNMKSRNQARRPAQRSTISPTIADAVAATNELSQRMAALSGLTAQQLRDEWRRLYRGQPPRLSRDLLIRSIAYRMQELAHGGLSKATQRTLATMTKELEANGSVTDRTRPARQVGCTPRARMAWQNPHGHRDRGRLRVCRKTYASLTRIAHEITGAHWSGPRFFGLDRKQDTGAARSSGRRLVEAEAPWLSDARVGDDRRRPNSVAPSTPASPPRKGSSRTSTRSMPSARPARRSSPARSTRAGSLLPDLYDDGGYLGRHHGAAGPAAAARRHQPPARSTSWWSTRSTG